MENLIRDEKDLHRRIAAAEKAGRKRVSDGGALYLLLTVKGGGRAWRFDYAHDGKRKTLSLGTYPDTNLVQARQKRNEARAFLAAGKDPSAERKAERKVVQHVALVEQRKADGQALPSSFREVFEEWHRTRSPGWSGSYGEKVKARIARYVLPWLGDMPIDGITEQTLVECLKRVQAGGVESRYTRKGKLPLEAAHATLQNCGQVFKYGIATGQCKRNPAAGMSIALTPFKVKHQAAAAEPDEFEAVMVAIGGYTGTPLTRTALMLLAATFQRPGNVRAMRWADLDLDAGMWTIPSADMKRRAQEKESGKPHLVPLCSEAVALLRELHPLTGHGEFCFPCLFTSKRPMSENTLNVALRRAGINAETQTSHGFRSTARTLLVERLGVNSEIVEAQLAHAKSGPLGAAYDRSQYLEQRGEMMAMWGKMVFDCARGLQFPGAPVTKAMAPTKAPAAMDPKALAAMIERLTGTKPTAAAIRRELAAAVGGRHQTA